MNGKGKLTKSYFLFGQLFKRIKTSWCKNNGSAALFLFHNFFDFCHAIEMNGGIVALQEFFTGLVYYKKSDITVDYGNKKVFIFGNFINCLPCGCIEDIFTKHCQHNLMNLKNAQSQNLQELEVLELVVLKDFQR